MWNNYHVDQSGKRKKECGCGTMSLLTIGQETEERVCLLGLWVEPILK